MTNFPIPSSPAKKILDIDNFNGVDFTSKVPDISRSNKAMNVIKRNGYHQIRKAFKQYVTSKPTQPTEEVGLYSMIGGADLLIWPTSEPEQITNAEFKEKYPDFEEGKIVLGNELGAMFIERNNPYQYGLFYVAPTSYGGNDLECMGYQVSKNIWPLNDSYSGTDYVLRDTDINIPTGTYTISFNKSVNSKVLFDFKDSSNQGTSVTFDSVERQTITFLNDQVKVAIYIYGDTSCTISNIQIEEGTVASEYTPYVYDDGLVMVGNIVSNLAPFTMDQWANAITIIDEKYKGCFYKTWGEVSEERTPKLVDKITGELWEETYDGYHKVSDEHEMYLKISSRSIFDGAGIEDYFQVFAEASLLGVASEEIRYYTEDIDRDNKPLEYYKRVIFNDKPHYFTTNGIMTVNAKQIKKLDGTITIDIECTPLGSYYYPAKTPIYRIGCDPEMTKFTQNEDINLINHMVEVGYKGDGTTRHFKLLYNTHNYLDDEEIRVRIMQNDGSWIEYDENDDVFTRDVTGDYIVFVDAPTTPPLDGYDNVFIKQRYGELNLKVFTYERKVYYEETTLNDNTDTPFGLNGNTVTRDPYMIADGKIIRPNDEVDNPYPNGKAWYWEQLDADTYVLYKYRNLEKCPTQTLVLTEKQSCNLTEEEYTITHNVKNLILYGDSEEKTLFINGDKNIQVYSALNDITYWPSSNYNVIGDESDISGFGLSNGYILTFKKGNNSIFVQQGAVVNNKTTYPVVYSEDAPNVLSEPIQLDDALYVFTKDGLQEVAYTENNLLLVNRSYFIDKKLKDMNFDTLTWFKWDDNLYFMIKDKLGNVGTHIFVADLDDNSRVYEKSSSVGNSFSTGIAYQYEWYYLYTKLKPIFLTDYEWIENNSKHLLGYNNEGLFSVSNDDSINEAKIDVEIVVNGTVPIMYENGIQAYWETPFIDMDEITKAKTIRGIYLNTKGNIGDNLIVFAKNIDEGYTKIAEITYQNTGSGEVRQDDFPRRIYIKDKIRKFMNVKYLFTNDEHYDEPWVKVTSNFSFNRLSIEYQDAGKYRGE